MDKGNAEAYYFLGCNYVQGEYGMPQDSNKANELWLKAGELGCADGYYNLGNSYRTGRGVGMDKKKASHYYELAIMGGCVKARNSLGCMEFQEGNTERAKKHWIIAAKAGNKLSLNSVKEGYMSGDVTKDEYASTLRSYQKSQDEAKSDMRDKAGAYWDRVSVTR